jgi:predicted site-specific integrase-resolvase
MEIKSMSVTIYTVVPEAPEDHSQNKPSSQVVPSTGGAMTGKRAAAYVRAANWEDAQEKLAEQERYIREWADLKGCEVVDVYTDIGSGNSEERPELQRLLSDSRAGKHEAVIAVDYARLFRNLSMMIRYLTLLEEECDVDLVIVGAKDGVVWHP